MTNLSGLTYDQQKRLDDLKTRRDEAKRRLEALDIADKEIGGWKDIDERIEAARGKARLELSQIQDMEKLILFEHYKERHGVDIARKMAYSIE